MAFFLCPACRMITDKYLLPCSRRKHRSRKGICLTKTHPEASVGSCTLAAKAGACLSHPSFGWRVALEPERIRRAASRKRRGVLADICASGGECEPYRHHPVLLGGELRWSLSESARAASRKRRGVLADISPSGGECELHRSI